MRDAWPKILVLILAAGCLGAAKAPSAPVAPAAYASVVDLPDRQSLFFILPNRRGEAPVPRALKQLRLGFDQLERNCDQSTPRRSYPRANEAVIVRGPTPAFAGVYTMQVSGLRDCLFLRRPNQNFVEWQLRMEFHSVRYNGTPAVALRITVLSLRSAHQTSGAIPGPSRFSEAETVQVEAGLNEMTEWLSGVLNARPDALPSVFSEQPGRAT
ncbi:MAG TPA: hypothetical protein VN018_07190 [Brevundimonas sp.]|nr:hypothetical protein [Brevundimonas sp.]